LNLDEATTTVRAMLDYTGFQPNTRRRRRAQ
jgi:hypothetical protein